MPCASTSRPRTQGDAFFCIVDLHSITVDYDPDDLHDRTLDLAALLFAVGLDPERSTLFLQSHVTAHAEAAWLLSAVTGFGQLGRMTQFKEKGEGKDFVSAGLFTYPVLMAGDILLYQTDIVPVGDDQRQHVELVARHRRALQLTLRRDVQGAARASTRRSARGSWTCRSRRRRCRRRAAPTQGTVLVLDAPDVIRKKFKTAVTDSGREVRYAPDEKPGVSNLIEILSVATGRADPRGRGRATTAAATAT